MKLVQGRDLGSLAEVLVKSLEESGADPIEDLFTAKIVVVPNQVVRSYVLQSIAKSSLGAAFNVKTPSLEGLLHEIAGDATENTKVLSHSVVRAAILGLLLGSPKKMTLPTPVRAYLKAPPGASGEDVRAYQLADRLASMFVSYATETPSVVEAWRTGASIAVHPDGKATETWEREIWRHLFGKDGVLAKDWTWAAAAWTKALGTAPQPPKIIHVFGYTHLSLTHAEVLKTLGARANVHLYLRMPSAVGKASAPTTVAEEFIADWSTPHRRSLALVEPLVTERVVAEAGPKTAPLEVPPAKILVTHGIQRECEAISDEIWRLIVESEQTGTDEPLRFSDIAVLVANPSQTTAYATELRTACTENHGIPLNLGCMSLAHESSVAEAALALLDLPLKDFRRSAMLKFLMHPAVCRRFGVEPNTWVDAVEMAGIFRGGDRTDQRGTYLDKDIHNWDQGLRRLALGDLVAEAGPNEPRPMTQEGETYLPVQRGGTSDVLLPVRALIADVRRIEAMTGSMTDWGQTLATMVEAYVNGTGDDAKEQRAVARALRSLGEDDAGGGSMQLSVAAACALAQSVISGNEAFRGHLLANGVHAAPLKAGEALPFKAVFVCGLADDVFPAPRRSPELDVRDGALSPLSKRQLDFAAFLESITSAKDRLVLSYVGFDEDSGTEKVESAPLRQLRTYLGSKIVKVEHHLRRYDRAYKMAGALAPVDIAVADRISFSPEAGREAAAKAQVEMGAAVAPAVILTTPPTAHGTGRSLLTTDLKAMTEFLKDPLQGWAKYVLELKEAGDLAPSTLDDDEPLELDDLSWYIVVRKVFEDAVIASGTKARPPESLLSEGIERELMTREANGSGPAGAYRKLVERQLLSDLNGWCNAYEISGFGKAGPFKRIRLGKARTAAVAKDTREPLSLDIDDRRVLVSGEIGLINEDETLIVYASNAKETKYVGAKELAKPYLETLALVTASPGGKPKAMEFAAMALDGKPAKRRLVPKLTTDQARMQLMAIIHDLLFKTHAYQMPIGSAHEYWRGKKGKSFADILAGSLLGSYGPVWRWEAYGPPTPDVVDEIITHRLLQLFKTI